MAKKVVFILILAGLVAGSVFAAPEFKMSVGAGGYFTSDFGGGIEGSGGGYTASYKMPYTGGGGFAFFDLTYAEVSLGFFGAGITLKSEATGSSSSETKLSTTGIDIGLMGKYPIELSEALIVFPLLGINYRAALTLKDEDGEDMSDFVDPADFNALWIKLGGGLDYSFTESIYLRGTVLYGIRLPNEYENDMKDSYSSVPGVDVNTLLGHGLTIKAAVGFRF